MKGRDESGNMSQSSLTPPVEINARIHGLQRRMVEKGLALVLIIQNVDLFYFSGTLQKGYLFIPVEGEACFFVQKNYERAIHETPLKCVRLESFRELPALVQDHQLNGNRVGMELDVIPVSLFYRIKDSF